MNTDFLYENKAVTRTNGLCRALLLLLYFDCFTLSRIFQ